MLSRLAFRWERLTKQNPTLHEAAKAYAGAFFETSLLILLHYTAFKSLADRLRIAFDPTDVKSGMRRDFISIL